MRDPVERLLGALPTKRKTPRRVNVSPLLVGKFKICDCGKRIEPKPGESLTHWDSRESCSARCFRRRAIGQRSEKRGGA